MSGVLTAVLNATFGVLVSKARDHTAKKLKEGDLTDEQCRGLIVRELDDIKSKLDGLARKDLLSSISFFKEGVCRLNLSVDTHSSNDEPASVQEQPEESSQVEGACGGRAVFNNEALPLKLAHAVRRLKIASEDSFVSAKSSFDKSNTKATEAFNNVALSIEDRILATQLRMASRILESLEHPEAAANDCKLYLEELHAMPTVREIFSVYLSGGMKSLFNKTQRLEKVTSVTLINFALCDFIQKFTKAPLDLFEWPMIELGKGTYHPICGKSEILMKMNEAGVKVSNQLTCNVYDAEYRECSALNSKGEIIIKSKVSSNVNVINSQGEIKLFWSLPQEETQARGLLISSLAIDNEDNVYIVTRFKQTDNVYGFKLFVFDAEGKLKHQFPLECLSGPGNFWYEDVQIAINMVKNIIIYKAGESRVHVYNKDGQLQYSFPLEEDVWTVYLSISDRNEIVVAPQFGNTVYIYTEEGKLKQTIKLPKDHDVRGVAFSHITKKVIVYTWVRDPATSYLLSYSETGELQTLPLLHDAGIFDKLTSRPNGPVALVHRKGVIFF